MSKRNIDKTSQEAEGNVEPSRRQTRQTVRTRQTERPKRKRPAPVTESVQKATRGSKRRKKKQPSTPGPASHVPEGKQYKGGEVLLVRFYFHDIRMLDEEADRVTAAFSQRGFRVVPYTIPMADSESDLTSRLNSFLSSGDGETLRIIYYHGHGGIRQENQLILARQEFVFVSNIYTVELT